MSVNLHRAQGPIAQLANAELLVRQARAQIEQFEAEQRAEPSYPAEPTASVIIFETNYRGSNTTTYQYAAWRVKGRWYLTGRASEGKTWEQLVNWLRANMEWVSPVRQLTASTPDHDINNVLTTD